MVQFVLSGLRVGIRGRALQLVFALGVLTILVAYFSAAFSPRQPRTVALDIGFSGIRVSLVLLNLLWIQDFVVREIERRTVFFSLAYPVPRAAFLLGRFVAVLLLSALALLIFGLLLSLAVALATRYEQEFMPALGLPFWATLLGLWVDSALVAAFALCLASISTVSALPLTLGMAFAVAGKALGPAMAYLASGADGQTELVARFSPILAAVRWLLPDLSRLDWRDWPLYQVPLPDGAILWALLMAAGYIGLALLAGNLIFERRELH